MSSSSFTSEILPLSSRASSGHSSSLRLTLGQKNEAKRLAAQAPIDKLWEETNAVLSRLQEMADSQKDQLDPALLRAENRVTDNSLAVDKHLTVLGSAFDDFLAGYSKMTKDAEEAQAKATADAALSRRSFSATLQNPNELRITGPASSRRVAGPFGQATAVGGSRKASIIQPRNVFGVQ
jgi:hypothetical protein